MVEPTNESGAKTMLRIKEGARLPPICCKCATTTDRLAKVRQSQTKGGESLLVRLLVLVWGIFMSRGGPGAGLQMFNDLKPTVRDLVLYIPCCERCKSQYQIKPEYVEFERRTVKIVVHREFRRQCEQLW
jgi:hypothetical protein